MCIRDRVEDVKPGGVFLINCQWDEKELSADVFVNMDSDAQEILIRAFSDTELKEVLDELYRCV